MPWFREAVGVGDRAPPFALVDLSGRQWISGELEGRTYVLEFIRGTG